MTIANGAGNSITRSSIVSGAGAAVLVQPGTAPASLTLDSSILSGGPSGSGLTVRTGIGVAIPGTSADATITARHITVAGSSNGIVLDSSAAEGVLTGVGNIAATSAIRACSASDENFAGCSWSREQRNAAFPAPGGPPPQAALRRSGEAHFRYAPDRPLDKGRQAGACRRNDGPRARTGCERSGAGESSKRSEDASPSRRRPRPAREVRRSGSTDRESASVRDRSTGGGATAPRPEPRRRLTKLTTAKDSRRDAGVVDSRAPPARPRTQR